MINTDLLNDHNENLAADHRAAFSRLNDQLAGAGIDVDRVVETVGTFACAIPSWALGTGGTRFGRYPGRGEPSNVFEKIEDAAVIHQVTRSCPTVSLHFPWDETDDLSEIRGHASALGLGFDAVNSNTFQDQPGQPVSYKFGSLCHTDFSVRRYAVEHILHVIEIGKVLGSKAVSVWLADGSSFPGQMHLRKSFDRTLASLQEIYVALPADWTLFTEHKPYEPAFYATVVQDWGTSYLLATQLGERAKCLVDLGHHLPNTNIELVVARLVGAGRLGGFHFNDSKYGDDDLTTGSIHPFQLFLVFNELVDAAYHDVSNFAPSYLIDQSHNLKDPIEALLQSVVALQRAYAKALLVDRVMLENYQDENDVLMAEETLRTAYETDVAALIAEARRRSGGAIDPIGLFRESGYRAGLAAERISAEYVAPKSL